MPTRSKNGIILKWEISVLLVLLRFIKYPYVIAYELIQKRSFLQVYYPHIDISLAHTSRDAKLLFLYLKVRDECSQKNWKLIERKIAPNF